MPTDEATAQDRHYLLVLTNLLDDGATIVADLVREAVSACDKAEPYERIARGIRRTVVLARHISANPVAVRDNPVAAANAAIARRRAPYLARQNRDETAADEPESESLRIDRLEDLADDLAIAHRDPDVVIGEIRRDLGVEPSPEPSAKANAAFAFPRFADAEHIEDDDEDPNLVATLLERADIRDG